MLTKKPAKSEHWCCLWWQQRLWLL